MCFGPPPKKKKKKKKKMTEIGFAFGPAGAWVIWMNAHPTAKEPPYYRRYGYTDSNVDSK